MPILSLRAITLGYGGAPLLDAVNLDCERGERLCLIGRNGVGKSTLLKVIVGAIQPDSGEIRCNSGVRIACLEQEAPLTAATANARVLDVVAAGLGELSALVSAYYDLSHRVSNSQQPSPAELTQLATIGQQLDSHGGWAIEQRAERVISRLNLDADVPYHTLSGGLRRRVLLARALIREPDVLLLDEPTNHLDIATIEWIEEFLQNYHGTLLFITHDRRFLRQLATRILELDRGQLTDWPGDYDNFLRRRDERIHAEHITRARFEQRLANEEIWIRQGIQARRTRNEGRVRALEMMRREHAAQRQQLGNARLRIDQGERSGKLIIEATGVQFAWPNELPLITELNTLIVRGDRVGIIGANGSGKTTLLKLLLGELNPTRGQIRRGHNLQVAYFDQLRAQLDPQAIVLDALAGGREWIETGGRNVHVMSYLKDFLFTPERVRQPVMALSGGERNRLLLAQLFSLPANVLVLDEPTNDLDAETLELLEELLHQFDGTLLLVSHDRDFLDHLVTSTLVLTGDGQVTDYVGGYSDWLRQRPAPIETTAPVSTPRPLPRAANNAPAKLSFKQQRELLELPAQIESLEQEQMAIQTQLADPALYRTAGNTVAALQLRLQAIETELTAGYARWEQLEALGGGQTVGK